MESACFSFNIILIISFLRDGDQDEPQRLPGVRARQTWSKRNRNQHHPKASSRASCRCRNAISIFAPIPSPPASYPRRRPPLGTSWQKTGGIWNAPRSNSSWYRKLAGDPSASSDRGPGKNCNSPEPKTMILPFLLDGETALGTTTVRRQTSD